MGDFSGRGNPHHILPQPGACLGHLVELEGVMELWVSSEAVGILSPVIHSQA